MNRAGIQLNGVRYRWPSRPIVVVCIDGGDPAYFERGVRDGIVPNVARFMKNGFSAVADGDVAPVRRTAGTVDDRAPANHQIVRHRYP